MDNRLPNLMKLIQFTDSTFPVGTFSFSNGLETASFEKVVTDADSLEQFTRSASLQAAFSDGVAALTALRACYDNDYDRAVTIDRQLMLFKMNDEARLMLTRMGKKLAELSVKLYPGNRLCSRFLEDITAGVTPGSYPVAQGVIFAAAGMTEEELYCSHQYGVINMEIGRAHV